MKNFFLYPGQFVVVNSDPTSICTILGSCVAVVLYDRTSNVCGLCHYLLQNFGNNTPSARYGDYAIPKMLKEMLASGAKLKAIEAKIYGGGAILDLKGALGKGVGHRNIEFAKECLKELKIPIKEENVGGKNSRKIFVNSQTGIVDCQLVDSEENSSSSSGTKKTLLKKKVKVIIVDDSATVRFLFQKVFSDVPSIQVLSTARDPYEARDQIIKYKPDVLLLDIEMPKMNGITFLGKLMAHHPLPVVMVSSLGKDGEAALKALELGAIDFVQKPSQSDARSLKDLVHTLVPKIISAASISPQKKTSAISSTNQYIPSPTTGNVLGLICITGNAGSNRGIESIINGLAADTPPVVVVSSTISHLAQSFIQKLSKTCALGLQLITNDTPLTQGKVYFACEQSHVKISYTNNQFVASKFTGPPVSSQRPSGDVLFDSAVRTRPKEICGVLLSGFGNDGASGLENLRNAGGTTIAEDPQGASFSYLPVCAIENGAAEIVSPAKEIANVIMKIRNKGILK